MKRVLKNLKLQIMANPVTLLKKPWQVFLIPLLLILIIYNRLKTSETVVYLTETKLDSLSIVNSPKEVTEKCYSTVSDYRNFADCAGKRINDETGSGNTLLNVIRKRFDKGDHAIVYSNPEGDLLSYVFICTELAEFTPVGLKLKMPASTFGIYDVYTFKDSRGKGYYSDLFYYTVDLMRKKGYNCMWLWLMRHNNVSVNVHYKLGIKNISKILSEKVSLGFIRRNIKDVNMLLAELISNE